jgi:hypothetical protein
LLSLVVAPVALYIGYERAVVSSWKGGLHDGTVVGQHRDALTFFIGQLIVPQGLVMFILVVLWGSVFDRGARTPWYLCLLFTIVLLLLYRTIMVLLKGLEPGPTYAIKFGAEIVFIVIAAILFAGDNQLSWFQNLVFIAIVYLSAYWTITIATGSIGLFLQVDRGNSISLR